jgi:hypothetical protein
MTLRWSDKFTIVRFLWPLVATLAGCADTTALRGTLRTTCAPATQPTCEIFGPARCACTTRADLDRALPNFGQAAWPGGPH